MQGRLKIDNSRISLFPDYSAVVQKQRAKFVEVKRRLRDLNVQYAMLYPSRLWVVARDEVLFFDNSSAAVQWLDANGGALRAATSPRREDL